MSGSESNALVASAWRLKLVSAGGGVLRDGKTLCGNEREEATRLNAFRAYRQ